MTDAINSDDMNMNTPEPLRSDTDSIDAKAGGRRSKSNRRDPSKEKAMTGSTQNDPIANPFGNLSALRLDQSYTDTVGVKKLLTTVPVRKPGKQDFVRVHSEPAFRLTPAAIIEVKEDREVYLVTPSMAQALPGEFSAVTLFTAVNRQGALFLWPVKVPTPEGRQLEWYRSAAEAAELAMAKWVRVTANMSLGAYDICAATGNIPDPVWPDVTFAEILKIAFGDRYVDRADHPLVQRLQGLV